MLQHDASTPRPHSLKHGIYGTERSARLDPLPSRISGERYHYATPYKIYKEYSDWATQEEFNILKEKYTPEIFKKMYEITKESGHGGSDLMEDWRLIDCLRNGFPLDQDVYDAALK